MKKILLIAALVLSGCASYSRAQVGPDRYALYSRNSDYTKLLESAYTECRMANHKDYIILTTVVETKGVTLVVQCVDSPRPSPPKEESHATATTPGHETNPATKTDEAPSPLQKALQDLKDTFK